MKTFKTALLLVIGLFGCGDEFISASNGSGEVTTTSLTSSSESTTSSTSISTTTAADLVVKEYDLQQGCTELAVFVPAQEYNNFPAVSCFAPTSYPTIVTEFSYEIYGGIYSVYGCNQNSHYAIWFVADDNPTHTIPDDVDIHAEYILSESMIWEEQSIKDSVGPVGKATVFLPDISLKENQIFCFGHKFAFDEQYKPTCIVACESESNLFRYQVAGSDLVPYGFTAINNIDVGGMTFSLNFISSVKVKEQQ